MSDLSVSNTPKVLHTHRVSDNDKEEEETIFFLLLLSPMEAADINVRVVCEIERERKVGDNKGI